MMIDVIISALGASSLFYEYRHFPQISEGRAVLRDSFKLSSYSIDLVLNFDFKKKIIMPTVLVYDSSPEMNLVINNNTLQLKEISYSDEDDLESILDEVVKIDIYFLGVELHHSVCSAVYSLTTEVDLCSVKKQHLL